MNTYKKSSYTNTLFFTMFNAILSLTLLIMLFFGVLNNTWIWAIVIIEVGIVFIIGFCVTQMVLYEKHMARLKDPRALALRFDNCPDYFARKVDENDFKPYCTNEYVVKGNDNNEYVMKVYPDKIDLPMNITSDLDDISTYKKYDRFYLDEIETATGSLPTLEDKCAVVTSDQSSSKLSAFAGYDKIPWPSVQNQCWGLFASLDKN